MHGPVISFGTLEIYSKETLSFARNLLFRFGFSLHKTEVELKYY